MTVYFAAAEGRIKIGYTTIAVRKRLQQISAHLPKSLELIGTIEGGREIERAAQEALSPHHLKGEWFRDCLEARGAIASIIDGRITLVCRRAKDYREFTPTTPLPENRRKARNFLLNAMWPGEYLIKLSEILEEPKETVALWLYDEVDMPDRARLALSGLLLPFLSTGKLPSFLDPSK